MGDFGCYFEKKYTSEAKTLAGTLVYMSPQQRKVLLGQATKYNAFKTDVYQLGRTAVALATLDCPADDPWSLKRVEQVALTHVQPLPYSPTLKDLLLRMLLEGEESDLR